VLGTKRKNFSFFKYNNRSLWKIQKPGSAQPISWDSPFNFRILSGPILLSLYFSLGPPPPSSIRATPRYSTRRQDPLNNGPYAATPAPILTPLLTQGKHKRLFSLKSNISSMSDRDREGDIYLVWKSVGEYNSTSISISYHAIINCFKYVFHTLRSKQPLFMMLTSARTSG